LARKASTRHSRFGTTISIEAGDRKYIAHKQAATINVGAATKVMNDIKKSRHKKGRLDVRWILDQFPMSVKLIPLFHHLHRMISFRHRIYGQTQFDAYTTLLLAFSKVLSIVA
jgi:hypothetical protein